MVYKPLEYFKKRCNGSEPLAQKAFTFFDGQRQRRIEELRARRQALIEENWKPGDVMKPPGAKAAVVDGTDDMVERERKRLEVLKKRCANCPSCAADCWDTLDPGSQMQPCRGSSSPVG